MIPLLLSVILLMLSWTEPINLLAAPPSTEPALLGGTIMSIDQEALTLTILFPTGESRALAVHHSRLLQGLSVGDHVTVELNHEHAVIKLTKLPTDPAN